MIINLITDLFLSKITILLINGVAIYLALLVFRDNRQGKVNRIYLAMTCLMLLWINCAYIPRFIEQDNPSVGLFFLKIAWIATPLFFYFLYLLTVNLINKKQYPLLDRLVLVFSILATLLTSFSDYIVQNILFINDIVSIIYGGAMIPFLIIISFVIGATLFIVFKNNALKNKSIRYFLVGLLIFYVANGVFNILLPIFLDISRFYFLGDYSTLILLSFTSYGILRYKLFNIKVFFTEILTFSIWLLLLLDVFTVQKWDERFLKIFILMLVMAFGLLLIRSVKNEIKQREKVERLARKLETANEKLQELDKAKTTFLSLASHQLRTPLTVIKGVTAMMLDGDYGKTSIKIKKCLGMVQESSNRLIDLVEDFLNISRIELGRIKYDFEKINLSTVVDNVLKELAIKIKAKNLKLIYEKSKTLLLVKVDKAKIREVIVNLVENAIKYNIEEGDLVIKLRKVNNTIEFSITDSGIGIDEDSISQMFKKFSRAKNALTYATGSGLGLYVTKEILKAHKGDVWAESKGENKGAKFWFRLPIKR